MRSAALHRYCLAVCCCTFVLLIAGGLVTSTQSGLSVPDWPTTYGHFMFAFPLDQMVGGIFYEHSHRMIASIVGILTVVLAFWLWRSAEARWIKVTGLCALGAVIAQGILGGLTVKYLLPTSVSVSHAALGQTFFCIVCSLALFTSAWWRDARPLPAGEGSPRLFALCIAASAAVFLQLILGAVMRHTESGLAVPDFPLAYGQLFPSLSPGAMEAYNRQLIQSDLRIAADGDITRWQIIIHMAHRMWALVAGTLVVWTSVRVFRLSNRIPRFSRLALILAVTVVAQITLGALAVVSAKAVDVTTAHVALGAFLLAMSVLTTLHVARVHGVAVRAASPAVSQGALA